MKSNLFLISAIITLSFSSFAAAQEGGIIIESYEQADHDRVPRWQTSLDGIEYTISSTMKENENLLKEYKSLVAEMERVQQEINHQKKVNANLNTDLTTKYGEDGGKFKVKQLKKDLNRAKRRYLDKQKDLQRVSRRIDALDQKIHLRELQIQELKAKKEAMPEPPKPRVTSTVKDEEKIAELKRKIQASKAEEDQIRRDIDDLVKNKSKYNKNHAEIFSENKRLESQIKALSRQLKENDPEYSEFFDESDDYVLAGAHSVNLLKRDIDEMETHVNSLNNLEPQEFWAKEREYLIQRTAQVDRENYELKEKINFLQQNVNVLKKSVTKLEKSRTNTQQDLINRGREYKKRKAKGYY